MNQAVARDAPQVPVAVNVVASGGQRASLRVEIPFALDLIQCGRGDVVDRVVAIQSLPLRLEQRVQIYLRPAGGGVLADRDNGTPAFAGRGADFDGEHIGAADFGDLVPLIVGAGRGLKYLSHAARVLFIVVPRP